MSYQIQVSKSAFKELEQLPQTQYIRISKAIDALADEPRPFGCKKLKNKESQYRIRVGVYRVVYSIYDNLLLIDIIRVRHRKDVYD
jgi:mRNA interferase RelE/StbE